MTNHIGTFFQRDPSNFYCHQNLLVSVNTIQLIDLKQIVVLLLICYVTKEKKYYFESFNVALVRDNATNFNK